VSDQRLSGTQRTPPSVAHNFLDGGGEMGALMRAHDWENTPLGAPQNWPQSLRSAVSICLGANFPIAIYWGPELALLYNDAWSAIPGKKHPDALGRPRVARDLGHHRPAVPARSGDGRRRVAA
jgi:hypothetical protein